MANAYSGCGVPSNSLRASTNVAPDQRPRRRRCVLQPSAFFGVATAAAFSSRGRRCRAPPPLLFLFFCHPPSLFLLPGASPLLLPFFPVLLSLFLPLCLLAQGRRRPLACAARQHAATTTALLLFISRSWRRRRGGGLAARRTWWLCREAVPDGARTGAPRSRAGTSKRRQTRADRAAATQIWPSAVMGLRGHPAATSAAMAPRGPPPHRQGGGHPLCRASSSLPPPLPGCVGRRIAQHIRMC